MKKSLIVSAVAAIISVGLTAGGWAATKDVAPAIPSSVFDKIDRNKDGKITAAERKAQQNVWFKAMDANADDTLNTNEYRSIQFATMDIDKNGVVTIEEYIMYFSAESQKAAKGSDRLDANADGQVDKPEWVAFYTAKFKFYDLNGDGKLTADEFKATAVKEMNADDDNKDGVLTREEFCDEDLVMPGGSGQDAAPAQGGAPSKQSEAVNNSGPR